MKTTIPSKQYIGLLIVGFFFSFAICSCSSTTANNSDVLANENRPSTEIIIADMAFSPAIVTIAKGTKVKWIDKQALMPHTVTSNTKGLFDSGNMHKNDTFLFTFNNSGTYTYYCKHHDKMQGKIVVE